MVDSRGSRQVEAVIYVRVCGKVINVCRKVLVLHLHRLELCGRLTARKLKLLDNVADLLKPMGVSRADAILASVRNHQKGCTFKEDDLVGIHY